MLFVFNCWWVICMGGGEVIKDWMVESDFLCYVDYGDY